MPNASVNIGGDASGALAAVAAAQGAIDGMTGNTVVLNVETRGGGAVKAMSGDMRDMANAAGRANRATRGMADNMERAGKAGGAGMAGGFARAGAGAERAGRAARGFGEESERAGAKVASAAGHAERLQRAVGAIGAGGGMRAIGADASTAGRGMRELESGASRAGVAMRGMSPAGALSSGRKAIQGSILDMERLADGTFGVAGAMKDASAGAERMQRSAGASMKAIGAGLPKPFSWAGVSADSFGNTSGGDARAQRRAAAGPQAERPFSAGGAAEQLAARKAAREQAADIGEIGSASEKAGGSARSMMNALTQGGSPHHIERMIRPLQEAGFQLAMVGGMMAGVAHQADNMMNATTGMGLNFKGMSAGIDRAEQSAARSHNLGLNGLDQSLRQTARGMTNELAPAMAAGVQATKAFEQAKMGAQASTGGALTGFANEMTKDSPALGGIMGSLGKTALNMGQDVVAGFSQTGPAFASMAGAVAKNGPEIAQFSKDVGNIIAGTASTAASVIGGAEDFGGGVNNFLDKALGARRDPSTGHIASIGHWGDQGGSSGAAPRAVAPGQFDPSKPFSGTLPDGTTGTGDAGAASKTSLAPPRNFSDMAKAGGGALPMSAARHPSADADWSRGMTGKQVYESEFQRATGGYPSTGPMPSGLGSNRPGGGPMSATGAKAPDWPGPPPGTFSSTAGGMAQQPNASSGNPQHAGFGSGVRPIPASAAPSLGAGAIAPLNDMMGAAQSNIASSSGATGQAMVQHVQKAVQQAAPAASAGGASMGAAMTGGMASGITTTQTVTDTLVIKHMKHLVDISAGALGVHSPSTEYDYLGRMSMKGYAQGFGADSAGSFGAMQDTLTAGHSQMGQYAYANGGAPTSISVNRAAAPNQDPNQQPLSPMQSTSSTSMAPPVNRYGASAMANIQAHNDRAQQLAAGRADNHAIALANLGVINPATGQRWADPRQADTNQSAGQDAAQTPHPGAHGPAPALPRVGPGSSGGTMSPLTASRLGIGGLPTDLHTAGQNSAQGLVAGMTAHIPKVQAAGAAVAGAGHAGYRKKDQQNSPSAVWAGMGNNSIAGVPVGFAAGVPAAVSAITSATAQMSAAIAGPLNNQGLMLGSSFATNVVTGAVTTLKNTNFQGAGTPQIANQQAAAAVGQIGLLGPGAGASVYKTPGVAMDGAGTMAQQTAAIIQAIKSQPIQMRVDLDGAPFRQMTAEALDRFVEELRDAHAGVNG